jgi:hypothetical protein
MEYGWELSSGEPSDAKFIGKKKQRAAPSSTNSCRVWSINRILLTWPFARGSGFYLWKYYVLGNLCFGAECILACPEHIPVTKYFGRDNIYTLGNMWQSQKFMTWLDKCNPFNISSTVYPKMMPGGTWLRSVYVTWSAMILFAISATPFWWG